MLLTGVTGFVGKVVLEELLRRKAELGLARVTLMIRPGKTRDGKPIEPAERFRKSVAGAELFAGLPKGWDADVDVAACDLEQPRCGLSDADFARVTTATTHVIHCAASVEFDLPIQEAAAANIVTALEVLELARACRKLVGLVDVSTAYVSAWRTGEILEQLAHLPRPAEDTYREIREGKRSEADLLAETGHPNTYTFTKCVTEHLVSQRRGEVPVIIVRPSIVSASWKAPFPGWLDSPAALAGCLLYSGLGVVRAWKADPATRLDVVPVDIVSQRIIEAAFHTPFPKPGEQVPIRYAAMGIEHAVRIDLAAGSTVEFFRQRPGAKTVPGLFLGRVDQGFAVQDLVRRELPTQVARALLAVTNRAKDKRRLEKADEKVRYLNSAFEYFTHHTFDFRAAEPVDAAGFDPVAYMDVVNRGLYKHLMRFDDTEMTLAGAAHDDARADLAWIRERPAGGWAMRTLGVGIRKAARRCASKITFDRPSFERAVAEAPPDTLFVLAPSHRSYLDFLLASYLCFQHPELGIPVPHIAAAEEFGKIPLIGSVLRKSQAFYIKRGAGKESLELSAELRRLADKHASLMFFVEGQRSRSRHFLPPKRGLLRGLQATERTFTILPISMAYDRLPEEASFERELVGGRRSRMSLQSLAKWLGTLARDQVQLGRMHIACGKPLVLSPSTDVPGLARELVAEQQRQMSVSSFHLRAFLAEPASGDLGNAGVDEAWLTAAIRARGGRVVESELPVPSPMPQVLAQSLRNQWMHWFYGDAAALLPENPAVADHVARNAWMDAPTPRDLDDGRVRAIVAALMAPVVRDYRTAATRLGVVGEPLPYPGAKALIQAFPGAHLPHLEDAYLALADRGILVPTDDGAYTWGPNGRQVDDFCARAGRLAPASAN